MGHHVTTKNLLKWVSSMALVGSAFTGCSSTEDPPPDNSLMLTSSSKVYLLDSSQKQGAEVAGATGWVSRFDDRIGASILLTGGTPQMVMTMWVVVFNNPDACNDHSTNGARCGMADLDVSAADGSIHYGGQGLVKPDGTVRMSTTLVNGNMARIHRGTTGMGDSKNADVQILVRSQGMMNSAMLTNQLTQWDACNGTCSNYAISAHEVSTAHAFGEFSKSSNVYFVDKNKDGVVDSKAGQTGLMTSPNAMAIMVRDETGVDASMTVYGVTPGVAYTAWFAVFNNWDKCTDHGEVGDFAPRCANKDLEHEEVAPSLVGPLAGGIADANGMLFVAGHLNKDDISAVALGNGLKRPIYADIHVTLRGHGQLQVNTSSAAVAQFSDFTGGCNPKCGGFTTAPNELATMVEADISGGH